MGINPFKETDLNDLQKYLSRLLSEQKDSFMDKVRDKWARFLAKGRERITIMFIPHTEKRIINFRISIFTIALILFIFCGITGITSFFIVKHSSTIKEVSILKSYGSNSEVQIQTYKNEMNRLYGIFQKFKPEITYLYSLTPNSNIDSLWAMGGVYNPSSEGAETADPHAPSMEELNMQEMETELRTAKGLMENIKSFLKFRKKIIENTPSIWPAEGYIISRFGQRNSPYTFKQEFYKGIDIEAFPGSEISAAAPGTVESIEWSPNLGLTVSVKHKYGFVTSYSHCQRVSVEEGQKVVKGEVIGYVGKTGKTTRYICFYQIRIGTEYVDPIPYLNRIIQ